MSQMRRCPVDAIKWYDEQWICDMNEGRSRPDVRRYRTANTGPPNYEDIARMAPTIETSRGSGSMQVERVVTIL